MPIGDGAYGTVIYATGVIDFTEDESAIAAMLQEGRRVLRHQGRIFIAFYRQSAASERFMTAVGLLRGTVLDTRGSLELHLMNPATMTAWIAKKSGLGTLRASALLLCTALSTTMREKKMAATMQKLFRRMRDPEILLRSAPQSQPYRNEAEIRRLFGRLKIPLKDLEEFGSCFIAEV
jgi:hypothetical protein